MFTGVTSEHGQYCRAIVPNPWWTVGRRTYGASQEKPCQIGWTPAPRGRGGLIWARGNARAVACLAQRRYPSTQYRRRLHLGPPARTAAELHVRTVDRSAHAAGGHHADVRQSRCRARRSRWSGDPLRDPLRLGAVGDLAADLCAGALPGPRPDDQGGADASRPVPLRLLRSQGRHRRPRGSAQSRGGPLVGELRGRVLNLQPPQGRSLARRTGLDAAFGTGPAEGAALAAVVEREGTRPGV